MKVMMGLTRGSIYGMAFWIIRPINAHAPIHSITTVRNRCVTDCLIKVTWREKQLNR